MTYLDSLRIADSDLGVPAHVSEKHVDLVLRQDDFKRRAKANLASSIAQLGEAEDMPELVKLIRADIERMRRGGPAASFW
jgi:hypothetical protein